MKVKIYTTPWCTYCKQAKEFFRASGVRFEEINVERDAKAAGEMVEKSGQNGVPVIDIDGTVIVGFDRHALQHALGIAHGH